MRNFSVKKPNTEFNYFELNTLKICVNNLIFNHNLLIDFSFCQHFRKETKCLRKNKISFENYRHFNERSNFFLNFKAAKLDL